MSCRLRVSQAEVIGVLSFTLLFPVGAARILKANEVPPAAVTVRQASGFDVSPPLVASSTGVEQTSQGSRPAARLLESFDGLGVGFAGPQGTANVRNPSDNSLAVGPNHIVEIVNSRMAVYTKKGALYETTGVVLYGPVETNAIFAGFGGRCEPRPNGDAVVRYDQLAERWLYVMPIFRRDPDDAQEPFSMCYAVSVGADPLGPYYRYEFKRSLFPDYPRPAIWIDGYYVPTSTGDHVIQKHACVVDRTRMLQGLPATEQCIIIDDVNFLNNADIDGQGLPPAGAPNIMMATGGTQLREDYDDDGIYVWKIHVDWDAPAKTRITGPVKIDVAPYHYLCNGQLTNCVPQPGTDRRLDAQGDKLMQRLVYRNLGTHESIVATHSINTAAGGGGVRWYEFRLDPQREPQLHQQGTYAPDGFYRWMASIGMDREGNIGVGYSFGGTPHYPGQRFAARLASDPPGMLTFHETVLAQGEASQTNTMRWQDYTTMVMDPADDCTFWYVGDYLKEGAAGYTARIGSFRLPGCLRATVSGASYYDRDHDGRRSADEPGLGNWPIDYAGGASGVLTTDARGGFSTRLPADPEYGSPAYTVSGRLSARPEWTATGGPVDAPRNGDGISTGRILDVHLKDRKDVTGLDFGNVCVVRNSGGRNLRFWSGSTGRSSRSQEDGKAILANHDPAWREFVNSSLFLVKADGSRFAVAGRIGQATDQFQKWLRKAAHPNISYKVSSELAVAALNIAFGSQDGNATIHDPVVGDWTTIHGLIGRVSGFIAANPNTSLPGRNRAGAQQYATLLEELNHNAARITPSTPDACPQPF